MDKKYYHTKESVEEYIKLATGFDGAELIEKLKEFLPLDSSLLEIGSGPGTDWEILNEFYKVTGSDNSAEFIDHLNAAYSDGDFLHLNATTLETDRKFDGIYSNKVLHHLKENELIESIKRQSEILNTSGIVCHSFWKGEGSEVFKGLYVNYHSADELENYFKGYFESLSITSYKEFDNDDSILFLGKKKS